MPQAILIVMQDVLFSQTLRHKLSRFGVRVFITETPVQAVELLRMRKMDAALIDIRGNNQPAAEFLRELKKISSEVETILISSIDAVGKSIEYFREGVSDEITVPFDIESLKTRIKEAVKRSRRRQKQRQDNGGPRYAFEQAMVAAAFAHQGEFDVACSVQDPTL